MPGKAKPNAKGSSRGSKPRKSPAKSQSPSNAGAASRLIDQRIRDLGGWRGETLARMRALILKADPGMTEEWKWNTPVWSHHGIVCTGEAYTKVVKLTFARGASLPDPSRLFNSSLKGNTRRAIDIHEGEAIDARAFKTLVKAAVGHNARPAATTSRRASAFALLALLAAMSCGDGGTEPKENDVTARLVSQYSDDGAALLEFSGAVEFVSAPAEITVYTQPGAGVTRLLLIRDTPGPMELTLRLPRGVAPPAAKVLDVSDGQDQPRSDVSTYKLVY